MKFIASTAVSHFATARQGPSPWMQKQLAPSAIFSLQNIHLTTPYEEQQIEHYLQAHEIRRMGDPAFDDCLFQSVLFTDYFEKMDQGELGPDDDLPARYFLKKSVELLQPLGKKVEEMSMRFDEMLRLARADSKPPHKSTTARLLDKKLPYVQAIVKRFEALEKSLVGAWADPDGFKPSREKACFLLFVHAMLSDAVDEMQGRMDALDPTVDRKLARPYTTNFTEEKQLIADYLKWGESELFSPGPLTEMDAVLCKACLNFQWKLCDMEKLTVPSFTRTGSQGVLAILHGIFNGKVLLSGAAHKPSAVHNNTYEQRHLATLRHDCGHLEVMFKHTVLSRIATALKPIYCRLTDPGGSMRISDVKEDLVVLFYMLHEDETLTRMLRRSNSSDKPFLHFAIDSFKQAFLAVDMIKLLNKVGFSITPVHEMSTAAQKADCFKTGAEALDSLWQKFRNRHAEVLENSGVFAGLPKFLED